MSLLEKQIVDQVAHFAFGFIISHSLVIWGLSPISGIVNVISFALGREIGQHDGAMPWALGRGSWIDMAFWILGGVTGALSA